MKFISAFLFIFSLLHFSCSKDEFITSPGAALHIATDTLRFDTVFTSVGSITKSFTIINGNDKKLRISSISLGGGAASPFTVNVNGQPGVSFNDYELNPHDSMYVFVKVTVDPTITSNPFLLLDSLMIVFNGNTSKVYLQAYGQNARFVSGGVINTNTTWNNLLPYVIENNFAVAAGATLTIEKGTRVYVNAKAGFVVAGTLKINGGKDEQDRVVFKSDRLDAGYRDLPAGWPGILFTSTSNNNVLHYANFLNAYQAIVSEGGANFPGAKILMNECIIQNAYDIGLYAINSFIKANNCLISQCGNDAETGIGGSNVLITGGGKYEFVHCTIATYSNYYQLHKQPVCYLSNNDGVSAKPLNVSFLNSIIYGHGGSASEELLVNKSGSDKVEFTNCIYKVKDADPTGVIFTGCLKNVDPLFDSINTSLQQYNFRLKAISPAIDLGKLNSLVVDLDGNPRLTGIKPDAGCYEKQ